LARMMTSLPLSGIRVLDSTYVFALPYAGGLLADMGAEVIKIEGPRRPDTTRSGGFSGAYPENELGDDWWNRPSTYNLLHRGKQSLTLDMTDPKGRELFMELVKVSDIVMENFTPRVMRGWGLDYPNLRKIKPDIILVSNTGYGHGDGPYANYPAQATTQEGTHGHCWVTGYPGEGPSKAGASFVDFLSTWTSLFAMGAALRYRNQTGQGQWIDISMYQAGVMFLSEYIMDAQVNGREGERIGNRHPQRAPQGCYPAAGEDQWITLSVANEDEWQALCLLMGQDDLAIDPRFAALAARRDNHDALDQLIGAWTSRSDKYDLMHRLQGAGIAAGPVLTGKDVHFDPHYESRGFLERVTFPTERKIGTRPFMGRPYKFSKSPLKIQGPAPAYGQHNQPVLQDLLGISQEVYEGLVQDSIVATVPLTGEAQERLKPQQAVELGLLAAWDPDYKEKLELD
jgi:crotonobetainyl-CoA:carnitine CoA-transferase CaiB-like acyl-CoA transferase